MTRAMACSTSISRRTSAASSLARRTRRTARTAAANRYLKQILYGNRSPLLVGGRRPAFLTPEQVRDAGWMFEVVFDYGEGHLFNETTAANGQALVEASPAARKDWEPRNDPFSSYRAGFEVRTYRLCQRVLMFHHIPDWPRQRWATTAWCAPPISPTPTSRRPGRRPQPDLLLPALGHAVRLRAPGRRPI